MILRVPTKDFKRALEIGGEALSKVIIQEERGHLLLKAKKDTLIITGTNNDHKALSVIQLSEEVEGSVAFTVDPKVLKQIISKVNLTELSLEHNKEEMITKVYTSSGSSSYATLKSFPVDSMLTFGDTLKLDKKEYRFKREDLLYILKFLGNYLAPLTLEKKDYDFIIFNNGIGFAANGLNKMGFFAHESLKPFSNFKIRKSIVPALTSVLSIIQDEYLNLLESERDIGVISEDKKVFYACLKAVNESPKINLDYLKPGEDYTEIDPADFSRKIERLLVSSPMKKGSGFIATLSGVGNDAVLDLSLVSNLKANERLSLGRFGDGGDEVSRTLDYEHVQTILKSFSKIKSLKMYFDHPKFLRLYHTGELNGTKFIMVGVGAFAKVKR